MDRTRYALVGLLAASLPVALAGGLGMVGWVFLVVVFGVGYMALTVLRTRTTPDLAWAAPGAGTFEFAPAGPRIAGRVGVAGALGRVEARQMLSSVAFWAGVWFAVLTVWLFGWAWSDEGGDIGRVAEIVTWVVHPLVGMLLIAAHRARTRARRDGASELFESCPASEHQRDLAHLSTAWVGAVLALLAGVALLLTYRQRSELIWGPFGGRQVAVLLGGGLLAVGAIAFGVLLARWTPWGIAPFVALVVIAIAILQLNVRSAESDSRLTQLSTAPELEGFDHVASAFIVSRWLAHQVWIAMLVLLVAALLWWTGTRRAVHAVVVGVVALALAVTGWVATRPEPASEVDRVASLIAEPERHQTCTDLGVPFCVYEDGEPLVDGYRPHLAAVFAALPADVDLGDLTFRQGADVRPNELAPPVRDRLASWTPAPGVPPVKLNTEGYDAARFWSALAATGVADETGPGTVVHLGGQSRGVVAIWAATRGVEVGRAVVEMASLGQPDEHGEFSDEARPWPQVCEAGPTPVTWSLNDLIAARTLIRMPEDVVGPVIRDDWDRWIDPSTTTDELLAALDLAPLGEGAMRTPVVESC